MCSAFSATENVVWRRAHSIAVDLAQKQNSIHVLLRDAIQGLPTACKAMHKLVHPGASMPLANHGMIGRCPLLFLRQCQSGGPHRIKCLRVPFLPLTPIHNIIYTMHTPPPHTPSLITLPRGGALSLPHLHLVSLKLTFYTICLFFFHKERERERKKKKNVTC